MIKRRGFTIIELLLYMGLVSIFLVVLTNIFLSVLDVQLQSEATASVDIDGRYLLSRLSYDLHRASGITTPAALGQTSDQLVLTIGGATHTYAETGGSLELTNPQGADRVNSASTQLSGFSVSRRGNPGGKDTITANFTLTDNTATKPYQLSVGLR